MRNLEKIAKTNSMLPEGDRSANASSSTGDTKSIFDDITSLEEADCYIALLTQTYPGIDKDIYCNTSYDGVSCWPVTAAGSTASVPCFSEFNGIRYDTNSNASRYCQENGTWSPWSNYRSCKPLTMHEEEFLQVLWDMKEAATIYYIGYGISLVALSLALFVFFHFKDLRCLRNTIHTNLMVTYLLIDVTWILTATLQSNPNPTTAKVACFLVILLTYLMATNFFWMFVEGLYLYILVVKTFSIDKIQFRTYLCIGWGIPGIVAAAWAIAKGAAGSSTDEPFTQRGCPWQNKDYYDYVFSCPVMLVLLNLDFMEYMELNTKRMFILLLQNLAFMVNIFFLSKIMWVLITKLRASNTAESRQYRKAAKALLVLIPLLGVTYIVVIATPSDPVAEVVFVYIQATLLSIQGFMVAVLYCFLNGEVQNSLRHHFERWRNQKSIGKSPRHSLGHLSPHHAESMALYATRGVRDSCTSFTTTTSIVNVPNRSPNAKRTGSPNHLGVEDDML